MADPIEWTECPDIWGLEARVGNAFFYVNADSWCVEIDDGVPSEPDGLPRTVFYEEGEANGLGDAKAKAVARYDDWIREQEERP